MWRSSTAQFTGGVITVTLQADGPRATAPGYGIKIDKAYSQLHSDMAVFISEYNQETRPSGENTCEHTPVLPKISSHGSTIDGHELRLKIELLLNDSMCTGCIMGFAMSNFAPTFHKLLESVEHDDNETDDLLGGLGLGDVLRDLGVRVMEVPVPGMRSRRNSSSMAQEFANSAGRPDFPLGRMR